jgi:DNA-binding HxlR family transcriptional regulator
VSKALPKHRTHCPISYALDVFGDKWTLLIVRDLVFKGKRRYGEFAESEEKIATNILSDRLSRLEAEGLVTRSFDPDNARHRIYELTDEGLDLAPVLVEMILWSAKHDPQTAADQGFVRKAKRNKRNLLRSIVKGVRAQRPKAGADS